MNSLFKFWDWFLLGAGQKAGWRSFWDRWLILHGLVGILLAYIVPVSLKDGANAVLLPLAGIFVGLSFAWAGNALALMQTEEISEMTEHHEGGFRTYVYTFQTAVLTILVTLVLWGLAGLGVFDQQCSWSCPSWGYYALKACLFIAASATLRECWHVVLASQWMLLAQHEIKRRRALRNNP